MGTVSYCMVQVCFGSVMFHSKCQSRLQAPAEGFSWAARVAKLALGTAPKTLRAMRAVAIAREVPYLRLPRS